MFRIDGKTGREGRLVEDPPVTWWELSFRVMDVRVNTRTERPNRGEFALLCDRAWALSFKQWNAS